MTTSMKQADLRSDRLPSTTAGRSRALRPPMPGQLPAAEPVAFGLCAGRFMPAGDPEAAKKTVVLFAAPWGLEELSTRKFFRVIAERLSALGIPSLRFDYPGTGDSLDPASFASGLAGWRDSLVQAAAWLNKRGVGRIILIGQGLGASLALQASPEIADLAGLALLAPVLSGRGYLRELSVWAKVVDDSLNLKAEDRQPSGVTAIASLVMPAEIASDVGRMKLTAPAPPAAVPCLVLERPGQAGTDGFAEDLERNGLGVERHAFDGYEALIPGPINARIPQDTVDRLVAWIETEAAEDAGATGPASSTPPPSTPPAVLQSAAFIETGVRFGDGHRLAGVLCQPKQATNKPVVLFFGSAYDRHAGWGRLTTETARQLAAVGIPSLRFDCAGVADSPPAIGAPHQVLYSPTQEDDAREALDFLGTSLPNAPILAVGRCSGAYLAFRTGLHDDRLRGLVLVNPYCFVWDEDRPLQEDLRAMPQSLATYRRKLLNPKTVLRVVRGEIDLAGSAKNLAATLLRKVEEQVSSRTGITFRRRAERRAVHGAFECLAAREVPVSLLYSRGDVGTDHLQYHFGPEGRDLGRYPEVSLTFLEETDHNLTPSAARAIYADTIVRMVQRLMPEKL
ncbi:alpha/beta hydrolase [Allorhizobium pseudoryzae]|uniref:alpha/beta hydrolase n=1 Tax=Allorhizobium pseudoryzae TaxID=379684 RepID=UPI003D01D188